MGLADDRKPVNLMTVHVSKSVTVHEVSNNIQSRIIYIFLIPFCHWNFIIYVIRKNNLMQINNSIHKSSSTRTQV